MYEYVYIDFVLKYFMVNRNEELPVIIKIR